MLWPLWHKKAMSRRPATHGPRVPLLDDTALFAKIVTEDNFLDAWGKVWANQGAGGGDRTSLRSFMRTAPQRLSRLRREIQSGNEYRPRPLRHTDMPRPDGGRRPLAIPSVRDRVAQTAVSLVLMPALDTEFEPSSFGYRRGRSVDQAVQHIRAAYRDGYRWVVDADIEKYFENVPHDRLMARFGESVSDGPLTSLIWRWLVHMQPNGIGLAQGSPLSPLLANLYLDRLDEAFHGRGMRFVRFADDFVILCKDAGTADTAMAKAAAILNEYGLRLNIAKSRVLDFDRGFRFLGHLFVRSMVKKVGPQRADTDAVTAWIQKIADADTAAEREAAAEAAETKRQEQMGYSPGFRVLHVQSADRRVHIRNQAFIVQAGRGQIKSAVSDAEAGGILWKEIFALPHGAVDRIDIGPGVVLTDEARSLALKNNVPIAHVDGYGRTIGWTAPVLGARAKRHLAQAAMALDMPARMQYSCALLLAKLHNQRTVLRRMLRGRDMSTAAAQALETINHALPRIERKAGTIETLMGYEGAAAAGFQAAINGMVPSFFRFKTRDRDRHSDPGNICWNFLSWLLHRDISSAVLRASLHPGFGALHASTDQRDACVYDLMEPFRPFFIGGLAAYLFNRRIVRAEMFSRMADGGWHLKSEGARALIRGYEQRVAGRVRSPFDNKRAAWRQLMIAHGFAWAQAIEGGPEFIAYRMDH